MYPISPLPSPPPAYPTRYRHPAQRSVLTRLQEQYLVNSKGYAQETALSRRVKEWGDKLRPDLVMQVRPRSHDQVYTYARFNTS